MRTFEPADVHRLRTLAQLRFRPDGQGIAFTETWMDASKNEYASGIFTIELDSGEMVPLADASTRASKPRWSPDGSRIAYVSHPSKKGSSLIVTSPGGTSSSVADLPEEIEDLEWAPDGRTIAFTARDRDEAIHGAEEPKDQDPKRIDHMVFRLDNVGWTVGRKRQLFVVSPDGGEAQRLTSMPTDVSGIAWSPDSRTIVTSSADHPTWDKDYLHDLFAVELDGATVERLTPNNGSYGSASFSPDGSMLAFHFSPPPLQGPFHSRIAVMELSSGKIEIITEELDRNCAPFMMSREPVWINGSLFFSIEDAGNVHLYRLDLEGDRKPVLVVGGDQAVSEFDIRAGTIAMAVTAPTVVSRLEYRRIADDEVKVLHEPNDALEREVTLIAPERFVARSADGAEVEAWMIAPPNLDPSQRYPMLLNIHGGPFTQYGNKFFDEFQVYAAAGYVVIYANPRGSSGYSESWGRAIKGPKTDQPGSGWGSVDYDDLMSVTDEALARFGFIDPERIGVMGGSYGGYMTSWIIGHTDRFKAAISERAVNSMYTMAYTSDMAAYFGVELGPLYIDDPDEYLRLSPISYVRQMHTPVLIIHSENDLRCPIEQAEQLFMALKHLGREVEFVRFPGESHELSRSGNPKHRVQRFEIVLDWFGRKL